MKRKHYGYLLRILHWCHEKAMSNALSKMELTSSQGQIMGYLAHRKEPPCSRDIEEEFHMSHPTAWGLLDRLEKKGFIEFRPDANDRRCKRIYILEKGRECQALMYQTILDNEARLVEGFTEEEKEQFYGYLRRAIANMGVTPCQSIPKEETKP